MPAKPKATSTRFLNISRDGDSTTALGSLFQCLTTLSVEKYSLPLPQCSSPQTCKRVVNCPVCFNSTFAYLTTCIAAPRFWGFSKSPPRGLKNCRNCPPLGCPCSSQPHAGITVAAATSPASASAARAYKPQLRRRLTSTRHRVVGVCLSASLL